MRSIEFVVNVRSSSAGRIQLDEYRNLMKPPAIEPQPEQESVWDYPRPPKVEQFSGHIKVFDELTALVDTQEGGYRVLETSHPPVFCISPQHVNMNLLHLMPGSSICEWKGQASYYQLIQGDRKISRVAWTYLEPLPGYELIAGYLSFYPSKVRCFVNDENVQAQEGDFYGGWITSKVVGPYKGGPGTWGW